MHYKEPKIKTATLPALRVEPQLREAAQSVLIEGETLSSFMEESLRTNIERRLYQQAFIARGVASCNEAKAMQEYYSATTVMAELSDIYEQLKTENQ